MRFSQHKTDWDSITRMTTTYCSLRNPQAKHQYGNKTILVLLWVLGISRVLSSCPLPDGISSRRRHERVKVLGNCKRERVNTSCIYELTNSSPLNPRFCLVRLSGGGIWKRRDGKACQKQEEEGLLMLPSYSSWFVCLCVDRVVSFSLSGGIHPGPRAWAWMIRLHTKCTAFG